MCLDTIRFDVVVRCTGIFADDDESSGDDDNDGGGGRDGGERKKLEVADTGPGQCDGTDA